MNRKIRILALGGSIVAPESGFDIKFLKSLVVLIKKYVRKGHKFVIVVGGGHPTREYIAAAKKAGKPSQTDLDWLGIQVTRVNAALIRTLLGSLAGEAIVLSPEGSLPKSKVIVAGGWKPGWSTDYVATKFAARLKVDTVINLSNIKYLYDKDPKKYKSAQVIESVEWKKYRKMIGSKWSPGLKAPFDPIASKLADQKKISVVIADGRDLGNFESILSDEAFKGSVIKP